LSNAEAPAPTTAPCLPRKASKSIGCAVCAQRQDG